MLHANRTLATGLHYISEGCSTDSLDLHATQACATVWLECRGQTADRGARSLEGRSQLSAILQLHILYRMKCLELISRLGAGIHDWLSGELASAAASELSMRAQKPATSIAYERRRNGGQQ